MALITRRTNACVLEHAGRLDGTTRHMHALLASCTFVKATINTVDASGDPAQYPTIRFRVVCAHAVGDGYVRAAIDDPVTG